MDEALRRSRVAILVVTVLAGLLLAVPASPTRAAAPKNPSDLRSLKSADQQRAKPEVPTADFSNPPPIDDAAVVPGGRRDSFDQASSKLVRRSNRANIYKNADGTETAVLSTHNVNWQDGKGDWHSIDPNLVADGKRWRNRSARVAVKLADTIGDGPLAEVAGDGWKIAYELAGSRPGAKAVVNKDRAVYKDVLAGVDAEHTVLPEGVKDELVVRSRPATSEDLVLRFPLTLEGVTATANADGSLSYATASGETVAVSPAGVVWDADDAPAENEALIVPLGLTGSVGNQAIEVRVPGSYLSDPARTYPVRIDPTIDAGYQTSKWDAFGSSSDPATNYNGPRQLIDGYHVNMTGYNVYPTSEQNAYQKFDLAPVMGKRILGAQWRNSVFLTKGTGFFRMYPVGEGWSDQTVTWNNKPNHHPEFADGMAVTGSFATMNIASWVANWTSGAWTNHGISIDSAGQNSAVRFGAAEQGTPDGPAIFVTYNNYPTKSEPSSPADEAIVMTDQPILTGSPGADADGETLSYWFRVTTNPDGVTGSIVNSGGVASPSWTVPANSLIDGLTYYWKVYTNDGHGWLPSSVRSFKVNMRLGRQDVSPMDAAGPVDVNLANGNLLYRTSSPSVDTAAGPLGVDFAYNSRTQQQFGLQGTYTSTSNPNFDRFVRRDRQLDFNWGNGSPGPSVPADNFDVEWNGFLTVPWGANNWSFGAAHDDTLVVKVKNTIAYGSPDATPTPRYGSPMTLAANETVPITVQLHEYTGSSSLQLWISGPVTSIIPASWLSTTGPPLPQGWSMSLSTGDGGLSYARAEVAGEHLVLYEPSGVPHEYRRDGDTGAASTASTWKPADADDDVVTSTTESTGTVFTAHGDDGLIYTFNEKGQLIRVVSTADAAKPAAPTFDYDPVTARARGMIEPISGRRIDFVYGRDPYSGNGSDCPKNSAAGLTTEPPVNMLCQIKFWDGTGPGGTGRAVTNLYYLGGQIDSRVLARIEYPGGRVTDFSYDAQGRPTKVREPVAADAVAGNTRADDDTVRTVVTYDALGRATSVTLPAPLAGDVRHRRSYTYTSATGTDVHVDGLAEPLGYTRRVTFDGGGHQVETRDSAGLLTSTMYDPKGRLLAATEPGDPHPLRSTNLFDHADRVVQHFGPAPVSCFGTDRKPNGTCPGVPGSTTAYDEGMKGLAASYWSGTKNLAGPATAHALGVGHAEGKLVKDWGITAPAGVTGVDNWSARFTGEVMFPAATSYTFTVCSDDGARLFIDDKKVLDSWTDGEACRNATSTVTSAVAGTRKRIRVDYYDLSATAKIALRWTPTGGTQVDVPGANLFPRYNLVTSSVDEDGKKTTNQFSQPEYGLKTATVVDPGGLNLTSSTAYETNGYRRRVSRSLPKGVTATYAYYTATSVAPMNECGGKAAPGLVSAETGADPDGVQGPIVREVVYDNWNRVVGRRIVGDSRWKCTGYDSRGRVTTVTDSSGKTHTINYATPGETRTSYADSSGAGRTTVQKTDLLGRSYAYTDELGTTTRTVFDRWGRRTTVHRTFAGGGEALVASYTYDPNGRLITVTEHVSGSPRATQFTHDAAGRLKATTRPNGVVTTTGYNAASGEVDSVAHTKDASTLSSWEYTQSPGGRITREVTTGRTREFTYDAAGRLTRTVEGAVTRDFAYDANTNRCARAATCSSPEYAYDAADRVLSSPDYSAYVYDRHGNVTAATPRTTSYPSTAADAFSFDETTPLPPKSYELKVGGSGPVNATLDWVNKSAAVSTTSASSQIAAGPASTSVRAWGGLAQPRHFKADLSWDKAIHAATVDHPRTVSAGSWTTTGFTTDGDGPIAVVAQTPWVTKTSNGSGTVTNDVSTTTVKEGTFTSTGCCATKVTLDWAAQTVNHDLDLEVLDHVTGAVLGSATGTNVQTPKEVVNTSFAAARSNPKTFRWRVTAKPGSASAFTVRADYQRTPVLETRLQNAVGTVLASASSSERSSDLTYPGAAAGTYTVGVKSDETVTLDHWRSTYQKLDWANVTVELRQGTTTLKTGAPSAAGQQSLEYTSYNYPSTTDFTWVVTNNSPDLTVPNFALTSKTTNLEPSGSDGGQILPLGSASYARVADAAGFARFSGTWAKGATGSFADVTVAVKNAAGQVVAERRSTSGSVAFETTLPAAGTYTVVFTNHSPLADVPSHSLSTYIPKHPRVTAKMELLNASGSVVATAVGDKPQTLSHSATPGRYTLRVTPTAGAADFNMSASFPPYPRRYEVGYDANDHATSINDGQTLVAETLAPSGRVLRRVVRDAVTSATLEDTSFGYADTGDSPAYARPTGGGTLTTYLAGVAGLDVIYEGTQAEWPLVNLHGDVVATTAQDGTAKAVPLSDEFGVGSQPSSRLGWLGGRQRYSDGSQLGLVRMGARLYDPTLGRFIQVDPVEAGSANDYDYVAGDPINSIDLDGLRCLFFGKKRKEGGCFLGSVGKKMYSVTVGSSLGYLVAIGCAATFGVATLGTGALLCAGVGLAVGALAEEFLDAQVENVQKKENKKRAEKKKKKAEQKGNRPEQSARAEPAAQPATPVPVTHEPQRTSPQYGRHYAI
jgi:RHS repeat-associated protein